MLSTSDEFREKFFSHKADIFRLLTISVSHYTKKNHKISNNPKSKENWVIITAFFFFIKFIEPNKYNVFSCDKLSDNDSKSFGVNNSTKDLMFITR